MEGDHGGDVGKPNKYYLSHVFKVNIIMLILSMYPWYYVMKIALCGPPPRPHTHRLIIRKTSDKTQLGDSLQNNWPLVLKTIKVIYKKKKKENKEKMGNRSEETEETQWLNAIWYPGWDSGTEQCIRGKTSKIWIKSRVHLTVMYWCWFPSFYKWIMGPQDANNRRNPGKDI